MKIERLLSVDDDEVNNYIVKLLLENSTLVSHFKILDGSQSALDYLQGCDAAQTFPNLILVDLKMPVMDGFGFIQHYEALFREKYPRTQLMVLSSSNREAEKQKALAFPSVRHFITKPLDEEKLSLIIKLFQKNHLPENSQSVGGSAFTNSQ